MAQNSKEITVIGFGELIIDKIYLQESDGKMNFYCYRGGGSISNCLANIANYGINCELVGVGGADEYGYACINDLNQLGVVTKQVRLINTKKTKLIYHCIYTQFIEGTVSKHSFSRNCPVCNESMPSTKEAHMNIKSFNFDNYNSARVVVVDKISSSRLRILEDAKLNNKYTILDLGRLSYIRFIHNDVLLSCFQNVSMLFVSKKILNSILKRTGLKSIDEFRIESKIDCIIQTDSEREVVICYAYQGCNQIKSIKPKVIRKVVDDAGAGDALLAFVIRNLLHLVNNDEFKSHLDQIISKSQETIAQVLSSIGARGHLPQSMSIKNKGTLFFEKGEITDIIHDKVTLFCPICGATKRSMITKPKIRCFNIPTRAVSMLPKRIMALFKQVEANEICKEILSKPGSAYVIGSGGSYSAATLFSMTLNEYLFQSQVLRPMDYIRLSKKTDYCFFLSYSGETIDMGSAIKHSKTIGVGSIVLLTSNQNPTLGLLLREKTDIVVCYAKKTTSNNKSIGERGFISYIGSIAPTILLMHAIMGIEFENKILSLLNELNSVNDVDIKKIGDKILSNRLVHIIGGGFAWASIFDFDSKSTESGLWNTIISESKDFSHGRFVSIVKKSHDINHIHKDELTEPVIYFSINPQSMYEKSLITFLDRIGTLVNITTKNSSLIGAMELQIRVQYLFYNIAKYVTNGNKYPEYISKKALQYYRWKGVLK